jgi:cupin fold WbuC family metalloprotein
MEFPPFQFQQSGVYLATEAEPRVAGAHLRTLAEISARLPRKRARICLHRSSDTPIHEMVIALGRETYVQPHRHHGKSESFHVIEGRCDVVLFDEAGEISEVISLGEPRSGLPFLYRIATPIYHTLVIRTPFFVIHETTNGPFIAEETEYAAWAPAESDAEEARAYATELRRVVDARAGAEGKKSE